MNNKQTNRRKGIMNTTCIAIVTGLCALVREVSWQEKMAISQEVAEDTFLEHAPPEFVRTMNLLVEQADSERTTVQMEIDEESFLATLNDEEKIAMERLFDLQGRKVSMTSTHIFVYPHQGIVEIMKKRNSAGTLFHSNLRRRAGFTA